MSALQLESGDAAIRINSERLSRRLVSDCLEGRSSTTRGRGHQTGLPTSVVGTFRTRRDVRLESVNRLKADMINAEKFQKWFELPKADLAALAAKAKGK